MLVERKYVLAKVCTYCGRGESGIINYVYILRISLF